MNLLDFRLTFFYNRLNKTCIFNVVSVFILVNLAMLLLLFERHNSSKLGEGRITVEISSNQIENDVSRGREY